MNLPQRDCGFTLVLSLCSVGCFSDSLLITVWGFMSLFVPRVNCHWCRVAQVHLSVSVFVLVTPPALCLSQSLPQFGHVTFPLLLSYSLYPFIQTFSRFAELQSQHLCRDKTWCASLLSQHKSQIFFLIFFCTWVKPVQELLLSCV